MMESIVKADVDHEVLILTHHKTMARDCWFETNADGLKFLVLRQISFGDDGGNGTITKQFRLWPEEVLALYQMIHREIEREK